MRLPIDDWQFWVTTLCALVALIFLIRALGIWKLIRKKRRVTSTRVSLTVGGRTPKKGNDRGD